MILDNIIVQVLSAAGGFMIGLILAVSQQTTNAGLVPGDEAGLQIVGFVVGLMVSLGYFVVMETLFQRTLAKFLTGTRVVTKTGEHPSFGQIVGRTLARCIPFEAFSFLGNGNPVGWHDSLSNTRVVNTR